MKLTTLHTLVGCVSSLIFYLISNTAKFVQHVPHMISASYCTVNDIRMCSIHDILPYMGHNVITVWYKMSYSHQ